MSAISEAMFQQNISDLTHHCEILREAAHTDTAIKAVVVGFFNDILAGKPPVVPDYPMSEEVANSREKILSILNVYAHEPARLQEHISKVDDACLFTRGAPLQNLPSEGYPSIPVDKSERWVPGQPMPLPPGTVWIGKKSPF